MPSPRARFLALAFAAASSACGARSSLEGADALPVAGPADAGPTCAATGSACNETSDCCASPCEEQICGGPPCRPGAAPVVLASGQVGPYGLSLDDTTVYFTNLVKAGSVMAVPKAGGAITPIVEDQDSPGDVAVDANAVFWTNEGSAFVARSSKDGASLVKLATGEAGASGIALDASRVYWVNYLAPGKVSSIPKEGGTPEVLATGGMGFSRIAVDDSAVTWLDFYGSTVLRVPKGGGTVTTVAQLGGLVSDLALDGPSVYVIAGTDVLRIEAPGSAPQVVATKTGNGGYLALDGESLYFTDPNAGAVLRVPKLGGQPTTIASGQSQPIGLAVDAWCVYWANGGSGMSDGSVMKAPR